MTLTYRLYAALANGAAPFAYRNVARKLAAAGVAPERIAERIGRATQPRPSGTLLWCHAASVGECLSALTLINGLLRDNPTLEVLLTSGTATSAEVLRNQMPARCRHQFAPLDSRRALRRFLAHWRPDMAIFVESELWPQMLLRTRALGIPMALLNARLSKSSLKSWGKLPDTARLILSCFDMIHAQDLATETGLRALAADPSRIAKGPNLKSAAPALRFDPAQKRGFVAALQGRPTWVAASTHPGEEQVVLTAHAALLRDHPDLLLILVPRHPERADEIIRLIEDHGLHHHQRSLPVTSAGALGPSARTTSPVSPVSSGSSGAPVTEASQPTPSPIPEPEPIPADQVYLADTMGEMGLWYSLSPIVFLGGSLVPVGGHNPFEPAGAGAAVLHGPLYDNFAEGYAAFAANGGQVEISDAPALAQAVDHLLRTPAALAAMVAAAQDFAQAQNAGLDALIAQLGKMVQIQPHA